MIGWACFIAAWFFIAWFSGQIRKTSNPRSRCVINKVIYSNFLQQVAMLVHATWEDSEENPTAKSMPEESEELLVQVMINTPQKYHFEEKKKAAVCTAVDYSTAPIFCVAF